MGRHKPVDMKARALLAAINLQTLQRLLPPQYTIGFNEQERILNIFCTDPPGIVAQSRFTKNEWYFLLTICGAYPHHAPYEILLANLTLLSVEQCRQHIRQAQQAGSQALSSELKPIREALHGVRAKLENLTPPLIVPCFPVTGYTLACSQPEVRLQISNLLPICGKLEDIEKSGKALRDDRS